MQPPTIQPPASTMSVPVVIQSAEDRPGSSEQYTLGEGNRTAGTDGLALSVKEGDTARPAVEPGKKKKKQSGSAEEEDADKGRRPCDMCRKRKVSFSHVVLCPKMLTCVFCGPIDSLYADTWRHRHPPPFRNSRRQMQRLRQSRGAVYLSLCEQAGREAIKEGVGEGRAGESEACCWSGRGCGEWREGGAEEDGIGSDDSFTTTSTLTQHPANATVSAGLHIS